MLVNTMMTQYPVIPIFYAPARSIYRTDKAVGWPSAEDPYCNPQDNSRVWMTHLTRPTEVTGRASEGLAMRYFLRKFGFFLLTLWAVVTLNFLIPRLQPGDPAEIMVQKLAGKDAQLDPAQVQAMRDMLGTPTGSLWSQYVAVPRPAAARQLRGVLHLLPVHGDRGDRPGVLVDGHPGHHRPGARRSSSASLLGAFAAWRRNSRFDTVVTLGSTFLGTPEPVLDRAAADLRASATRSAGSRPPAATRSRRPGSTGAFIYDAISHAFLPALTLLIVTPIGWILGMRNTMIMNLNEDYIKLAKAKGLPDRTVALRYAARNALLPSVTGFALALGGGARRRDPGRDGLRLPRPRPADGRGGRAARTTRCCRR